MKKIFLFFFLSSIIFAKVDINLSHKNIKHGTTFGVILQSDKKLTKAPNVIFKNQTFQMFTINGSTKNYEVFLPVDYYAKKQKENVQVKYYEDEKLFKKNISINIVDGNYKKNEIIKVKKGKLLYQKK